MSIENFVVYKPAFMIPNWVWMIAALVIVLLLFYYSRFFVEETAVRAGKVSRTELYTIVFGSVLTGILVALSFITLPAQYSISTTDLQEEMKVEVLQVVSNSAPNYCNSPSGEYPVIVLPSVASQVQQGTIRWERNDTTNQCIVALSSNPLSENVEETSSTYDYYNQNDYSQSGN